MKKKNLFLLLLLIAPVLVMAQFKIDLSISPGISKIYSNEQYSSYHNKLGISLKAGLETNYFFNSYFGIGTGAYYYYNKGNWSYLGTDMGNLSLKSVSMPINLYYKLNNQKLELNLGASINLRLSKKPLYIKKSGSLTDASSPNIYYESGSYKDGYINLHTGISYYFNERTKIRLMFEAGLHPFLRYSEYQQPSKIYFVRNAYLQLNYNIFNSHFKDIIQKQKDKTALNLDPFKIDFSVSTGLAKTYIINESHGKEYGRMRDYKDGFSHKEGIEINYDFKSDLGIGIGLFYSYSKSNNYFAGHKMKQYSKAISIPVHIQYRLDLFRVGVLLGTAVNFNLNEDIPDAWNTYFYKNNLLYFSIHAGCFYQLSEKIKLSFILERDVEPYYTYTYMNHPSDNYYFGSMNLKLSYTLFGK